MVNRYFFLGSVGPVETSESRSFLLSSRSGRSGFREYRPVMNGILNPADERGSCQLCTTDLVGGVVEPVVQLKLQ
jgi:hypothetical protein